MAPNKSPKSPYSVKDSTSGILFLQNLLNLQAEGSWTKHLDDKEVRFVYDMVSKANSFADFTPTVGQSKWMIVIIKKIQLVSGSVASSSSKKKSSQKAPSKKLDHVSRRAAMDHCKKRGVAFEKSSPPLFDIAMKLHELGAMKTLPTRKGAKKQLVDWYKSQ